MHSPRHTPPITKSGNIRDARKKQDALCMAVLRRRFRVHVCVYVCVREREKEREKDMYIYTEQTTGRIITAKRNHVNGNKQRVRKISRASQAKYI